MEPGSISYLFYKTQKRNQDKHPREIIKCAFEPRKSAPPKVPSTLIFLSFCTDSHLRPEPTWFFQHSSFGKSLISLGNSFPINSSPHFPCKLNILSFQFALPQSINMDSWWAACNLSQGQKWTHNTAHGRAGAYGPEPYRIWAPKSQKTALHTSWPY